MQRDAYGVGFVLMALLVLSGCGSSGGSTESTSSLTKTEFVEKTAWDEGIEKGEEDPNSLRKAGPEFAFYKSYSMGIDYGLTKCWLG